MRTLKGLVVVLAICGVAALIVASRETARPRVAISSIGPSMNFAYVRIGGTVPSYPTLSTADGYLSFFIQDEGGQVRVAAYRTTVDALLARGGIPMPGDQVSLEGNIRVRDDDVTLTLNVPDALTVERADTDEVELAALDAMPTGSRTTVTAQVRDVHDLSPTLRRALLRYGDVQAQMIVPLGLTEVFGAAPELRPGQWIRVSGGVGEYRGQRQMLPARAEDIQEVTALPARTYVMRNLTKGMVGRWVAVQGTLGKLQPVKGGMLLDLRDPHGDTITVAMFDPWVSVPFSQTLRPGDTLTAQGELVLYKGQLEIQPELSADLSQVD
jgi:DNA/RNA endonuclease YhcR with UshA esterase domain